MKMIYAFRNEFNQKFGFIGKHLVEHSYLHRKLEDMNGFEYFAMNDSDLEDLYEQDNGIIPVSVVLSNGKLIPATMYFWFCDSDDEGFVEFRSLVVLPYDKQGNEEALERYQKRAYSL